MSDADLAPSPAADRTRAGPAPHAGRVPLVLAGAAARTGHWLEVLDPWNDEVLGEVAAADERAIEAAVTGAAHRLRHPLPGAERAALLERFADALLAGHDALARQLSAEGGKPIVDARVEVERAVATARVYAEAARALNDDEREARERLGRGLGPGGPEIDGASVVMTWRPVGTVVAYTPFNFPANTVVHKLAAAIAAGCPVVLKPSEKTPLTALALGRLLVEAGAPDGLVSVLSGHYDRFGQLVSHPAIDAFTFTGHTDVGAHLARQFVAMHPTGRLHLELGGQAAQLCLDDVPAEEAAALVAEAVWRQNGARCTTPRKILVPDGPWAERFVEALVALAERYPAGDPADERTRIGPMIDREAAARVGQRIEEAVAAGAVHRAGSHGVRLVAPTVLDRVGPDMSIFTQETFGPVASVVRYASLDAALELANAGRYGLQPAVLTDDLARGAELAGRLRAGVVNVGRTTTAHRSDRVPFGGVDASGIGREGGLDGVREFCHPVPWKFFAR